MNLQHLQYLITLYNTGSMVEAAELSYVTQPTISKAVKSLETEFSIDILEHSFVNKICFTSDGEEFVQKALEIIAKCDELKQKFSHREQISLNICSQHYIFVLEAFTEVLENYKDKNYEMTLKEVDTKTVIDSIYAGRCSLGVIYKSNRNEVNIDKYLKRYGILFKELGEFNFHAFLSKEHPLAKKEFLTTEDLRPYPFVCYAQRDYSRDFLEEGYLPDTSQVIRVSDRDSMYSIINKGLAYNIGTGTIGMNMDSSNLCSKPIMNLKDKLHIGYLYREDKKLNSVEEEFINCCQKKLHEHNPFIII